MRTRIGRLAGLAAVPVLLGATSAASLALSHAPWISAPAALPEERPRAVPADPSARASGKLVQIDHTFGSFIVELSAECGDTARRVRTFVIGQDLPVAQQGHTLPLADLQVGNFIAVDYITIDGAHHARAVTVPDVPSRV